MSWTATIQDLTRVGNGVEVAVLLTDGVSEKFVQRYPTDGTLASLVPLVRATVSATDRQKTDSDLVVGAVLDLTEPIVVPPKPDAVADQFRLDLAVLRREHRAEADGLETGVDRVALLVTVQTALDKRPDLGAFL